MSAQCRSTKALLLLCLTCLPAWAGSAPSKNADVELVCGRYRTTEHSHGLYEIRQAADAFIVAHNRHHRTAFEVLGPDLRIMVSRCLAPLTVKWDTPDHADRGKGVVVSCSRTADARERHWDIFVPVYVPRSRNASKTLG